MPIKLATDWSAFDDDANSFDPNDVMRDLGNVSGWIRQNIEHNGSEQLDDEGAPMFKNYGQATIAVFMHSFVYCEILRMLLSAMFQLDQGDITEEQFHHEIDERMAAMEQI